jgi:hypothetical protein
MFEHRASCGLQCTNVVALEEFAPHPRLVGARYGAP